MKTINNDIKNKSFKHIYLLYGQEGYLVNQFKKNLINALTEDNSFNLTVVRDKPDWGEIISVAETLPFMAKHRLIVFDRCNIFKSSDEKANDFFRADFPDYLVIVIAEDSVDKRKTIFKTIEKNGYVCELGIRSIEDVIRFITGRCNAEDRKIGKEAAVEIYNRTMGDLGLVSGEVEKLIAFTYGRNEITVDDVKQICSTRIEAKVFKMIEKIVDKKKKEAISMYFDMLAAREAPVKILIILERYFFGLMQVSTISDMSETDVANIIGEKRFIARKYLNQVNKYTPERLKELVNGFIRTEEDIKIGRMSDRTGCELMIAEALS